MLLRIQLEANPTRNEYDVKSLFLDLKAKCRQNNQKTTRLDHTCDGSPFTPLSL